MPQQSPCASWQSHCGSSTCTGSSSSEPQLLTYMSGLRGPYRKHHVLDDFGVHTLNFWNLVSAPVVCALPRAMLCRCSHQQTLHGTPRPPQQQVDRLHRWASGQGGQGATSSTSPTTLRQSSSAVASAAVPQIPGTSVFGTTGVWLTLLVQTSEKRLLN